METTQHQRDRFVAAYDDAYDDVLRFVQRRLPGGAEDMVAEAMTAAWRRADELPDDPGDARAWLFGIARNCLLNHRRGLRRQGAVAVRLAQATATTTGDQADEVALRTDLARAWAALSPTEQEVLALAVLDGLSSQQAADVLGTTAVAYRHRLQRARLSLRQQLTGADRTPVDIHTLHPSPTTAQEIR